MRKTIRLLIPMLLFAAPVQAQWIADGVGICMAIGNQNFPVITYDNAGGWFVAWVDNRGGAAADIYVQRFNGAGTPLWAADGVAVCNAVNTQTRPCIVSDDAGRAIVAWMDHRSGTTYDIYAQRVNANGTMAWTANGVPVGAAMGEQVLPHMLSDGAGGAFISWTHQEMLAAYGDVYAQRINAAGVALWTPNGVPVATGSYGQGGGSMATDGTGGVIIAWDDNRYSTGLDEYFIFAQRLNSAGVAQWTANGIPVSPTTGDHGLGDIVADGSGGAVFVWKEYEIGFFGYSDVYAQRINSAGALQWAAGGVAIRTAPGVPTGDEPAGIIPDGFGGAIITWRDPRGGAGYDVYAQRVNSAGAVQWTANGIAVSAALNDQGPPVIVQDAFGGAVISWPDTRSGSGDIYAQRISSAGAPQWTADGVALCVATGNQSGPAMIADGSGGAVVAWEDARSGARDIYAQRVLGDGQPVSFTVTSTAEAFVTGTLWEAIAQANFISGLQTIRFNFAGPGPHTINVASQSLPPITDFLTIDGFTQPGASPNTNPVGNPSNAQIKVEISGPMSGSGIHFQASGTLRGVAINGFDEGVLVDVAGVVIEGNYIGTDASGLNSGTSQQGNGVRIFDLGINCRVGGSTPAARNVICNSYQAGILIDGANANAQVYGNYIGVGADASYLIPNACGIRIVNSSTSSRIGSSVLANIVDPAEANLIMGNLNGVVVEGSGSVGNMIVGNRMVWNSGNSIDLGNDGHDLNDAGDGDTGPNDRQNYPDLSSAVGNQISGTLSGAPNQLHFLQFYWSPGCCTYAGRFVGGTQVTTDGSGTAPFTFSPSGVIPPATRINATATSIFGSTSEVSFAVDYQNTGAGSSQLANLVDANGALYGTATYSNVTSTGNTFVQNPYTPPVPVSGWAIGNPNDPQIYYNITTDASYTGGVDICLKYDENNIPGPEASLVLLHYDGSMWANVTTSHDTVNNTVCGHVTSLSPFVIGASTTTGVGDAPPPDSFALHANVPNPFNPITTIKYEIPAGGADVNISIYDVAGRLVRDLVHEHRTAGVFSVQWNGDDDRGQRVASGVYFYRMRAGEFVDTKKMVLLK